MKNIKKIGDACCGCGACKNICPRRCISMTENDEGFIVPYVDDSICVGCGMCLKTCPVSEKNSEFTPTNKNTYIGYNKTEEEREISSSGGLFVLLAKKIISEYYGVVFGAAFNEKQNVIHIRADCLKDLTRVLTSKYVQSDCSAVFPKVLDDLKCGKKVLFSGTPCQIEGLKKYIQFQKVNEEVETNIKDNLYTVDFVCHGVPSSGVWRSYKSYLEDEFKSNIIQTNFRSKRNGWHDYSFKAVFENGIEFKESHELNVYMHQFLLDKNIRLSCLQCKNKGNNYYSDITLADAWKVEKVCQKWADDKGTSLFIIRSQKGEFLLNSVKSQLELINADYEDWCKFNPSLIKATQGSPERDCFFDDYKRLSRNDFWNKYRKIPFKKRIRYFIKKIAKVLRLEKILRKIK